MNYNQVHDTFEAFGKRVHYTHVTLDDETGEQIHAAIVYSSNGKYHWNRRYKLDNDVTFIPCFDSALPIASFSTVEQLFTHLNTTNVWVPLCK